MTRTKPGSTNVVRRLCALALIAGMLLSFGANAAPRTFVASTGKDSNPCSLGSPCRGFLAAMLVTDPGGEIVVLDSAGYGALTINKSISIVAPPGVYAGITVSGGDGITVDAPGINVSLEGLAINGQGGNIGIVFSQGASLVIQRCSVENFAQDGISIAAPGLVVVSNSSATKNGNNGMFVGGNATVAISDSRFDWNFAAGVSIIGIVDATIDRTVFASNGTNGLEVISNAVGTVNVGVDSSSTSEHLQYGVFVGAGLSTTVRIAITRSTIALNTNGFYANNLGGTTIAALTDNDVVDNIAYGITSNGTGSTVRASANRVMRNGGFGIVASGGGVLYSPATNYVRDNSVDDGGHTADSLL